MSDKTVAGTQNFIRLQLLLATHGEPVLKELFIRRYKSEVGLDWRKDSIPNKCIHIRNLFGKNYLRLPEIQRMLIETGDINQWDMTLLSFLILEFKDRTGSGSTIFLKENSYVEKLRALRNQLAHHRGEEMSPKEFNSIWKEAETILTYFGVPAETIGHIRTTSKLNGIKFQNDDFQNAENTITAKSLKEKGNNAMAQNMPNDAIKFYSQALLLAGLSSEDCAVLHSNRSQAFLKILKVGTALSMDEVNENSSKAMEDARRTIELRPNWWKGYSRLGQVHQFNKDFDEAILWFDWALGLDPTLESVRNARDECRNDQEKVDIHEHMDPLRNFTSREEIWNTIDETRGLDKATSSNWTTEFMKRLMNSEDPSIASLGWVYIAHNYSIGDNVPLDMEMAAELFKKAADVGNVEGIYNLGLLTRRGAGVQRDVSKAVKLFEQAARTVPTGISWKDLGISEGKYMMGRCYHEGVGFPKDYETAIHWYREASIDGIGNASNNLNVMFQRGEGVKQSYPKGMQYARLAVEQGCPNAVYTLFSGYIFLGHVDLAEMWLHRLWDTESAYALAQKPHYEEKLKRRQQEMLTKRKYFPENIYLSTVPTYKLIQRMMKTNFPEHQKLDEAFSQGSNCQPTHQVDDEERLVFKIAASTVVIHQKAIEGSVFAQTLSQALIYFGRALENLGNPEPYRISSTILEDFAKATELAQFMPFVPQNLLNQFREIVNKELKSNNPTNEYHARVCYIRILRNSVDEAEKFCNVSKLMFPNESYFYDMHSCYLGFLKKFTEGAEVAQQGIDRFPDICDHYYNKAVHLKLGWDPDRFHLNLVEDESNERNRSLEQIIQAYNQFLEKAPTDHRKIPESYYSMAMISVTTRDMENAERFYQLGLKSEQSLLPCFLPYKSTTKPVVEAARNVYMRLKFSGKQETAMNIDCLLEPDTDEIEEQRKLQSTNPKRVIICRAHRKSFQVRVARFSSTSPAIILSKTKKPMHFARAPKKGDQLQEITLEEMDPTKDHVYKGRFISLTIMEDSLFKVLPSIHSIAMDKNGDFQRIYFYNLNHDDKQTRKNLKYGSKIKIKNPYHRLTSDYYETGGKALGTGIRVDDPKSLVFVSEGVGYICRFCWKENVRFSCSKCKRANYCSKECQIQDCKLLWHKRICTVDTFNCI